MEILHHPVFSKHIIFQFIILRVKKTGHSVYYRKKRNFLLSKFDVCKTEILLKVISILTRFSVIINLDSIRL